MKYDEFVKLFNSGNLPELSVEEINLFIKFSCISDLLVDKCLWENSGNKINIHAYDEWAFRMCCTYGRFEVAKWLWEISDHKINIYAKNNYAFIFSCKNGHLKVAKWLWIISKCTIAFSLLKEYHADLAFLNTPSNKYRYKYTDMYDNLHMLHHYYKPVNGPGYLNAINE